VLIYEMSEAAKKSNLKLADIKTYTEVPPSPAASGGTLTTAIYQLSKKRGGPQGSFDPLLTNTRGEKSSCATKVTNPKSSVYVKEFDRYVGPWIMAPVMANCIRRSNALLEYNENLSYGEGMLSFPSRWDNVKTSAFAGLVGLSLYVPFFQRFLSQPGEGPSLETMEQGWTTLHARGKLADAAGE